jgi:hypothetical protein
MKALIVKKIQWFGLENELFERYAWLLLGQLDIII